MATDNLQSTTRAATPALSATDVAKAILAPLASLRLTVCLLVLGVLVTFIASIQQTREDAYSVKTKHVQPFIGNWSNSFVEVPFQTLLIPAWFPNHQNIPGRFYIPGGGLLLIFMMINLTAAHALRFRLHARGTKLLLGLGIAGFASLFTWVIVFNGQDAAGFQSDPPVSWAKMWTLLQLSVLGIAIGSTVAGFQLDSSRRIEKWLLGIGAAVCFGALGITVFAGKDAFIGDSAMRILWQLTQATIAALISFLSCSILFKRKAGIVLIHLGLVGLMANEIYVTKTNLETRMTVFENKIVSHAVDVRTTEMAIINTSDPDFDEIITIPGHRLRSNSIISNDQLPFDVKCVKYFRNSDLRQATKDTLATAGIGKIAAVASLTPSNGTDPDQPVDMASAYVELTHRTSGESLGTFLISQVLNADRSDTVEVDGIKYRILLQFETKYKPYSVELIEAKQEYYVGTKTPKWYSSNIVLTDFKNDSESNQLIWMNNPLRYSGETFYQSGMDTTPDGKIYSVFQVVRNHGWMIPYVCCMFTVVGLLAHFGTSLIGFLKKQNPISPKPIEATLVSGAPGNLVATEAPRGWLDWLPAVILVGAFSAWGGMLVLKAQFAKNEHEEMRLDLLGQIPVTIKGRVQPLDSLARNTTRNLREREYLDDGNNDKQTAILWLADTMFGAEGHEDYRLFRIIDKTLIGELELPSPMQIASTSSSARKNFVFTVAELADAQPNLDRLLPQDTDPKSWTPSEKRLGDIAQDLQKVYGIQFAFGLPERLTPENIMNRLDLASRNTQSPFLPLIVPGKGKDDPWKSMIAIENQDWLFNISEQFNASTVEELASAIIESVVIPPIRENEIRDRAIREFLANPEFLKMIGGKDGEQNPQVLARVMLEKWGSIPDNIKEPMVRSITPMVDALIEQQLPKFKSAMEDQLIKINGSAGKIRPGHTVASQTLKEIQTAYREKDSKKFNAAVETYLAMIKSDPPRKMSQLKFYFEKVYNGVSPFYFSMVVYLAAFLVATFGWIGWKVPWNRASTGLLYLGLTFQIGGIISRVVISGRPPITNLYSSALFVSAAAVILLIIVERITKLGIGNALAGIAGYGALIWAWTMSIADGDTFSVMVAVLDTQFWLATHVVIISLGYAATFVAGLLGCAYLIMAFVTPAMATKKDRRAFGNVIYGAICFGLFCSFFGTVLGGLWGDDAWGRFWGWDPKENGALMIVFWNAVVLHARWGGMVRERGMAALAILGNVVVLWSWKGVNAMGVGLHAYADTEDKTIFILLIVGAIHLLIAASVIIPRHLWMSYQDNDSDSRSSLA